MLANAIFIANAGKQQLNLTDVGRRNVLAQVKARAAVLSSNQKLRKHRLENGQSRLRCHSG